jgi:hypothetical protein
MRKLRPVIVLASLASLAIASCKKSEDAPDANAPSATPAPAKDESEAPSTPAAPAEPHSEQPAVKSGSEPPAEGTGSPLDKNEYKNVGEAESALASAKSELDQLLQKPGGGADRLSVGDSRCENACKALASMKRAADAVCRLAGDGDTRCKKARTLVKDSEGRVSVCKCDG